MKECVLVIVLVTKHIPYVVQLVRSVLNTGLNVHFEYVLFGMTETIEYSHAFYHTTSAFRLPTWVGGGWVSWVAKTFGESPK